MVADPIMRHQALLDVHAAESDIMTAVVATSRQGAVVVTPEGVATLPTTVGEVVVLIEALRFLATYTLEAMVQELAFKGIDVRRETVEQGMDVEIEATGGLDVVSQMSPAELEALAARIAAAIPAPVSAHAPALAHAR